MALHDCDIGKCNNSVLAHYMQIACVATCIMTLSISSYKKAVQDFSCICLFRKNGRIKERQKKAGKKSGKKSEKRFDWIYIHPWWLYFQLQENGRTWRTGSLRSGRCQLQLQGASCLYHSYSSLRLSLLIWHTSAPLNAYRWEIYRALTWPLIWTCKLCWERFLSFWSQLTGTYMT